MCFKKEKMKTYIFLTNSIGGISGGPIYVCNKLVYLIEQGWNVVVFDSTGLTNAKVVVRELRRFEKNRLPELFYYPSWFNKWQRDKVIKYICDKIPNSEECVIESNSFILGAWGEILAKKLSAKHLLFSIGEHNIAKTVDEYDFLKFKAQEKELYSIFTKAYEIIFDKFSIVGEPHEHVWNANVDVPVKDINVPILNTLNPKDVNIGYFGRYKPFLTNILLGINSFALNHKESTINLIILGMSKLPEKLNQILIGTNINVYFIGSSFPLPKDFFSLCKVIFATSGCARIAYNAGSKVIGMDVKQNKPIGVLGYDTRYYTYADEQCKFDKLSVDFLNDIFDTCKYEGTPSIKLPESSYGYTYQMKCIYHKNQSYYNTLNVFCCINISSKIHRILIKLGFCKLLTILRHKQNAK